MKSKIIFITAFLILLSVYFIYSAQSMDKRDDYNYELFNKSNLNGHVKELSSYARGIKLSVKNNEVVFYPLTSKLNDNNIFLFTAEKGDLIIKVPFQDTLIVKKKNGAVLRYTFLKFKK